MPIQKVIYSNNLLKFIETKEYTFDDLSHITEQEPLALNIFNWNTLYRADYLGNGEFKVKEKVGDSPPLKEGEEYLIFYNV